ncbi:hypothetical protein LXA43DRAFT_466706 [Ganoderma leucocontextum]|nr:hypothetical protein LXA43DRAFT_466706 [Ganoderma leucocontextum]
MSAMIISFPLAGRSALDMLVLACKLCAGIRAKRLQIALSTGSLYYMDDVLVECANVLRLSANVCSRTPSGNPLPLNKWPDRTFV